jgi:hypothetical protein
MFEDVSLSRRGFTYSLYKSVLTTCVLDNIKENVDENMKKAIRSAYALFGCGFHGENGLDSETMIHFFKTYITPILLYGMEVLISKGK